MNSRPIELYLVELEAPDGSELFHKIGVSRNLEWRFSYGVNPLPAGATESEIYKLRVAILKARGLPLHPYKSKVICRIPFQNESAALLAERDVLDIVEPAKYTPKFWFSGHTECFKTEDRIIGALASYMRSLST